MTGSPGVVHVEVRTGAYADSVALLQVSRDVAAVEGVLAAQVAMATPLNVDVLAGMGFDVPDCSPNDMVVAVRVDEEARVADALAAVDVALRRRPRSGPTSDEVAPRTTRSALAAADASLVLVSVPGPAAAVEAADALDAGCDVMVFSDNVPVEQEVALKTLASDRGLLVMGPDCGTAVVGGTGLGFANELPAVEGPGVGIVAASGTGCQQLLCLLSYAGVRVPAALGVGGRDLSSAVGGLSTREALRRLDADPAVDRVVVVSKPPDAAVAATLSDLAGRLSTPVDLALLGPGQPDLTASAEAVLRSLGVTVPTWPTWPPVPMVEQRAERAPVETPYLRGLFVGGTLCQEARLIAAARLGEDAVARHTFVDFGDDEYTRGRAHPMIDPTLRLEHVRRVATDPTTGVLLLDVVLGHGAEPDPAALLAPAVRQARADSGRALPVVVACVGTEADPQGLTRQAQALADAGAEVFLSNAEATRRVLDLLLPEGPS